MINEKVRVDQSVAILVDGNNIERSLHGILNDTQAMLNFDTIVPRLVGNRALNRLVYFKEGRNISQKLAERLQDNFYGSVRPCHKSADIPLSIKATQLAGKVDTIIIMSGDADFVELVTHLKGEGVRVEVAAIEKTTSPLMKEACDFFHPIVTGDWFTLAPKGKKKSKTTKKKASPRK